MPTMNAPTESLIRAQFGDLRVHGDGNTLTGYAAVFDVPTEIKGWEGHFMERIAPGAFAKTLAERGSQIKVLFNHGMDPTIGDKPLGVPQVMKEDGRGLYVEVPLDDTTYNRDLRASIKSGAINGMSFRFTVTRSDENNEGDLPERIIREVKLYEFGPVTFPAYEATTAGIRGAPAYREWIDRHEQPSVEFVAVTDTTDLDASAPPTRHPLLLSDGPRARLLANLRSISNGTSTRAPGRNR